MFCFTVFIFCIIMFQTSTFLLFYSRNSPREQMFSWDFEDFLVLLQSRN